VEGGVVGLGGEGGFVAERGGQWGFWEEGRGLGQVVTEEAEGEDGQGEGVAGAEGVAIEEASEGFIVVFYGALGQ